MTNADYYSELAAPLLALLFVSTTKMLEWRKSSNLSPPTLTYSPTELSPLVTHSGLCKNSPPPTTTPSETLVTLRAPQPACFAFG